MAIQFLKSSAAAVLVFKYVRLPVGGLRTKIRSEFTPKFRAHNSNSRRPGFKTREEKPPKVARAEPRTETPHMGPDRYRLSAVDSQHNGGYKFSGVSSGDL